MDLGLSLARLAWSLLPVLAVLAVVGLVLVSAPSRRFFRSFASADGPLTWWIMLGLLLLQVLVGAVERRPTGASPFLGVPVVGQLLAPVYGDRLMVLVLAGGLLAAAYALFLRAATTPAALLLLAWAGLTVVVTVVVTDSVASSTWLAFAAAAACFVAVALLATGITTRHADVVLLSLGAVLVVGNLYVLHAGSAWAFTDAWSGGFLAGPRFQGTLPQPNVTGQVFACVLVLALWTRRERPLVCWALAAGSAYLVYLSGSRGAVVLLLGVVAMAVFRHASGAWRSVAGTAAVGLAVALPLSGLARSAVVNGREVTWDDAFALIARSPALGSGVFPVVGPVDSAGFYAHNQVLQTATETGLLGVLLVCGAMVLLVRSRTGARGTDVWVALVFGVLLTFSFENPVRLFSPEFGLIPCLVAIAAGVAGRRAPAESPPGAATGDAQVPQLQGRA
ncbi:hypothetical protein SAMN04488570_3299 [Nocardioides scoriae]|uniref:O-antigen ligase-related domain-containing protein n=1 Tax=Nocardioides scoriae TaxID=642780 RepID=A0A1H1WYS2_9ACTN|nr:O-antigen ligase family protein [Nocardioides scoriae]SDT01566.1 hypothetical protein SAMN04488570_3299 [Nocardioides scoriae]